MNKADTLDTPHDRIVGDFEPDNFLTNLFRTARAVLLSPRPFYEGMRKDGGFRNPFIFLASCVVLHSLLAGLVTKSLPLIGCNLVSGIVMPFVTSGLLLFFLTSFFKARGTYERAFRVIAYATAINMFSWIPGVELVLGSLRIPLILLVLESYRVYLIVVGLSCAFSIKASRAFLAVVITLFTYMVAGGAIVQVTGGQWPKLAP